MANRLIGKIVQVSLIGISLIYSVAFILLLYRIIYNGSGGGDFEGLVFFGYIALIVWGAFFLNTLLHELFEKGNHSILRLLRITGMILLFITLVYAAIWIKGFV